jgi:ferredoxin-NADP reductase
MHDVLVPGMTIELAPPFGSFIPDVSQTAVLISAGIGITAMKAFKQGLGDRVKHFLHVDKTPSSVPFLDFFESTNIGKNTFYYTSQCRPNVPAIIQELIQKTGTNNKFYMCGPPLFMRDCAHALGKGGVSSSNIAWEAFSPQLSCPV